MGRLEVAEITDQDRAKASEAMDREVMREDPDTQLQSGLRIASIWSAQHGHSSPLVDERRLELAYARIVARERAEVTDPVALTGKDYARMLVVDAALQREAEKALKLDLVDRQMKYSWMNPDINEVPWVRTDTSPTVLNDFAEDDLKALASGNFEDLSNAQKSNVELMLLRGASPRSPELDAELDRAAGFDSAWLASLRAPDGSVMSQEFSGEHGDKGAWADAADWLIHQAVPKMATVDETPSEKAATAREQKKITDALLSGEGDIVLADKFEVRLEHYSADQSHYLESVQAKGFSFKTPDGKPKLSAEAFGGVVDRLAMVAPGQRPAYDARPQYNPFSVNEKRDGLQTATVNAVVGGRIKNKLEQATRIAMEFQQERGIPVNEEAKQHMEGAVMRFVSSGERGMSPKEAAKVLIVDAAMQRSARERLEGGDFGHRKTASVQILEDIVGKGGYPVFTKLESEKKDTLAIAQGRFSDLTDERGLGSAVYLAIHRSGRDVRGDTGAQLDRLAKANPVGKEQDKSWVKKEPRDKSKGREALKKLTRGPAAAQQMLFPSKDLGR